MSDVPEGYKMSEVGVIPEGWDVIKMGDVFEFKNGLNKEKKYFGHGTPIVNYIDVYKNNALSAKDLTGKVTVTKTELKAYKVRKDDVFFTRTSETVDEIGITSVITDKLEKTVFSGFILRARPKNNWLDTRYKKYCFSSENVRKGITSKSSYTTRALTNGRLLSEVQIPLPPLPEQQAIASTLSDVDALITALEQLISKKCKIKQGAMQQLLTGKKRLPGFGGEWEVKNIGDFASATAGGTPSTLVPEYWNGDIRWMSSGELNLKKVYGVEGRITEIGLKNSSTKIVPPKCVLIGLAGQGKTRGTAAINYIELCTNQSIAAIFPNDSFVPEYLFYNLYLRYNELRNLSTGDSGRGGLNLKIIKGIPIPFPSKKEQQAIAQILTDMGAEIESLEQKQNKYKAIKQGMMQELLTGKTRLV